VKAFRVEGIYSPKGKEWYKFSKDIIAEKDEDALDVLIQVYKEHEKDLLRSRGLNPYTHRLKAVKTEDGVRFYVVRRPLTVAILWPAQGTMRQTRAWISWWPNWMPAG